MKTVGVNLLMMIPDQGGGPEVYARRMVQGLADCPDLRLKLFVNLEAAQSFEPSERVEIVVVEFAPERFRTRLAAEQKKLPRLARKYGVDVLFNPLGSAPRRTRCPQVVTIHDLSHERFGERLGFWALRKRRRLIKRSLRGADRLIAVSEYTAEDLRRFCKVEPPPIEVIAHGVDTQLAQLEPGLLERVRERYSLPESFAFLPGRTLWHKNHVGAVRAIARLREDWDAELPLVLCGGEGEGHADMLEQIEIDGVKKLVRHLGRVEDSEIPALYSMATCLLFPSRIEGFGLPLLEAFACGCPVICSNTCGLPRTAGDAALLVDPDHVEGMAHALRLVMSEPELRASLIERGKARASQMTWYRTVEQTAQLLRAMAGD
ncbi:MAG: glycosyltransferase family 1 protein [Candidatus Alcyoniella australis]|nr:glycosyltransferase family 1 protein [Candidatus Alcyoniella australis]